MLWNREIANAHLAQVPVEVAAKRVEQPLPEQASVIAGPVEPTQQEHQVQDNQVESALHRIGHPEIGVK